MDAARLKQEVEEVLDGRVEAECKHCERIMRLAELASGHRPEAVAAMAAVLVERFHRGELYFNDADRQNGGQTFALLKVLGQNRTWLDRSLGPDFIDLYFHEGVIVSSWFDYRSVIGLILAHIGDESLVFLANRLIRAKEEFIISLNSQSIFRVNRYHDMNKRLFGSLAKKSTKL